MQVFIVENSFTHEEKAFSTLNTAKEHVINNVQSTHDYKWWFITQYTLDSNVPPIFHYFAVDRWCAYATNGKRAISYDTVADIS